MIILPIFYEIIPNSVPAFVDFFGNTVVAMDKSYLAIFRLPIMGLLLTVLCIIMYKIELTGENIIINKIIWSVVAFIGALKMGITSMEILFYDNMHVITVFRTIIMFLVIIGIMFLVYGLVKIYKNKIPIIEYKNGIKSNSIKIIGIICGYIAIVLMPFYV